MKSNTSYCFLMQCSSGWNMLTVSFKDRVNYNVFERLLYYVREFKRERNVFRSIFHFILSYKENPIMQAAAVVTVRVCSVWTYLLELEAQQSHYILLPAFTDEKKITCVCVWSLHPQPTQVTRTAPPPPPPKKKREKENETTTTTKKTRKNKQKKKGHNTRYWSLCTDFYSVNGEW